MTLNHSRFRLAFVLSVRAPFVAIACSLGGPASAAGVDTISHPRPPNSYTLIQTLAERSRTRRPAEAGATTDEGEPAERSPCRHSERACGNLSRSVAGPAGIGKAGGPVQSRQVTAQRNVLQPVPIQAALDLLKWPPDHVPMIEVVDVCPPGVSPNAEGWTVYDGEGKPRPTIYVAGWSALYRAILANRLDAQYNVIRLAGVLAHERTHIEHGRNEELAYLAQLTALEHLRAHDIDIANVRRALEAVKRQQRGPD